MIHFLFGCSHKKTSFPITPRAGAAAKASTKTYVVCLECGREFPYSWEEMKIIRKGDRQRLPELSTQPVPPA